MSNNHCVIVGASHAGVSLAMQLRKEGWEGEITLIGAESEFPYHRPPLSKEHLAGEKPLDAMRLRPEQLFANNNIKLLLGVTVLRVDTENQKVSLSDGQMHSYDKLALCTGAKVNTIPLGADLDNVFYVRTAADISLLTPQLEAGKNAVIIGAGYIGLETAAVLRQMGLSVTVVELAERILQRVTSETMSNYMHELHEKEGVRILTGTSVSSIEGSKKVEKVVCKDGATLDADIVIIGVGVSPSIELAELAGLETNGGIVVDEFARTSDPNIYAAGDCTIHPSVIYERLIRLESVQNANDQARCAAANICRKQQVYDAVPWFWSDQYKIKLQMTGLNEGADDVIVRGKPSTSNEEGFALFYLKDDVIVAADCVARPKEFMVSKKLVQQKTKVAAEKLADESVDPSEFISS